MSMHVLSAKGFSFKLHYIATFMLSCKACHGQTDLKDFIKISCHPQKSNEHVTYLHVDRLQAMTAAAKRCTCTRLCKLHVTNYSNEQRPLVEPKIYLKKKHHSTASDDLVNVSLHIEYLH